MPFFGKAMFRAAIVGCSAVRPVASRKFCGGPPKRPPSPRTLPTSPSGDAGPDIKTGTSAEKAYQEMLALTRGGMVPVAPAKTPGAKPATSDLVLVEKHPSAVAVITLNRPKSLNALNDDLVGAIIGALREADADPNVRAAVLTGSGKAFAAGADIKEMASRHNYSEVRRDNMLVHWNDVANIRMPVIAAVNGFALGGGCELAMACDIIVASDRAKFGQPEIKLGTIPGCGGTQRLIRAIGKSKAMEWILTGDMYSSEEAEKAGLVAKVFPRQDLLQESIKMAEKIAAYSAPVLQLCKECVNAADNMTLNEGLRYEKGLFHATWGLEDRREGFQAFIEKREPDWKHA